MPDPGFIEFKAAGERHTRHDAARLIPRRMAVAAGANSGDQIAATLDQYFGGRRTAGRGNQYGDATRGRRQTHFRYEAHCLPDRSFSLRKEYQVGRGLASLRPV
jgi:hypothetical protein